MEYSVDSVQQQQATLVGRDGQILQLPLGDLPPGTVEGDVVLWQEGSFVPAPEKTAQRRAQVADLLAGILRGDAEENI